MRSMSAYFGIAPGDEGRHDEILRPAAEPQIAAGGVRDLAARGGDNGAPGGNVPLMGGGKARIDVDGTFGDFRKLQRRAQYLPHRALSRSDEFVGFGIAMRAADRCDPWSALWREAAGADRLAALAARDQPLGAMPDAASPDQPQCRRADNAQQRHAVFDQREVDGELVPARDEFPGAVERIDQEKTVFIRRRRQ